jgi:hypothetical protein
MTIQIGYCTNVHAGADLAQTRANLQRYACAVKQRFRPDAPMGLGLWLSASAARAMIEQEAVHEWRAWLADVGLVPFTLNGFPYGDFHQRVVKHQVYLPTWAEPARLEYTRDLITILHGLLPDGMEGSISTLPIAWGRPIKPTQEPAKFLGALRQATDDAVAALRQVAYELAELERRTGRFITICLEPEPGCVLQNSWDVQQFFGRHLLPGHDERLLRRHLRVCHDICHHAVMFEDQAEVLRRYHSAGIAVGKVQVSSAVCLPGTSPNHDAARAQLAGFTEERYLHQTVVRSPSEGMTDFYEDLPLALAKSMNEPGDEWRVHFHVPIYLERFGHLQATPWAIRDCLRTAAELGGITHFEVETYAWGVLPPELQEPDLAVGIAREMEWFENELRAFGLGPSA